MKFTHSIDAVFHVSEEKTILLDLPAGEWNERRDESEDDRERKQYGTSDKFQWPNEDLGVA